MFLIITCKLMYSSAKCCAYALAQNTSMYSTSTIKFTALLHDICLQSCTSCMYTHKHFLVASFLQFVFSIASVDYTERKLKNKNGGGLGARLTSLYFCHAVYLASFPGNPHVFVCVCKPKNQNRGGLGTRYIQFIMYAIIINNFIFRNHRHGDYTT